MTFRTIKQIIPARRDDIGDLVTRRPLPSNGVPQIDPFLFLNHHGPQIYPPNNSGLPFGPHPHRGFETVTFILDGSLSHLDTGGGESIVGAGGVQWMTAGKGLIHAELSPHTFKEKGGPLEILQLWVNLPSKLKMVEPDYKEIPKEIIPTIKLSDGAAFRAVSGAPEAPKKSLIGTTLGLLTLSAGTRLELDIPDTHNILFYVISGHLQISQSKVSKWHLVEFDRDGDRLELTAENDCLILFGHSEPIGEPIFPYGPFVMNTREEIIKAVQDYESGLFGDPRSLAGK